MFVVALLVGLAGCATNGITVTTTTPTGGVEQIPAELMRPEGPGIFPAVVLMHDCSGLGPRSGGAAGRWAKVLVAQGYVVILPDSFGSRGFADGICTVSSQRRSEVSPARRARDAYAALAYLRTLPFVDAAHIGLMGGSHGGTTTLVAMLEPSQNADDAVIQERRKGFSAAVALYPTCADLHRSWLHPDVYHPVAPLLILIGEQDDWTPAEPCRRLAEDAARAGYPVAIKIYPGAHHAFDGNAPVRYVAERVNANAPGGRGATTGGDPTAWADSIREVVGFFDRRLK